MAKDVFKRLQERLDQYSLGFPATASGVEIKILKKLFSEQDAAMFLSLTPRLETPEEIAGRVRMPPHEVAEKLRDMAARGLLFRLERDDTVKYGAIPFVHGLYEFQIKRLDREMAALVRKYSQDGFENAMLDSASSFLRTIPVQRSIDVKHNVAPYEDASEILRRAKKIVVTECVCRKASNLIGKGCDKPLEVCFMFGSMGQYYVDHGMGRELKIDEALEILAQAQEAGLVTQPASSQNPTGMCNCCGDCCGPLVALNNHPRPAEAVFSNYFAEITRDLCTGCGTCEERCQMRAIKVDEEGLAAVNLDRCIGCGLCVTTCPAEALKLTYKPPGQRRTPPADTRAQMLDMARKRGLFEFS
jgi:electron transport complex protein RnfB